MKKIFIAMAFIGASLLSLNASAQTYRGFTLYTSYICASSNGVVQTAYPGYTTFFNVDDFFGSTIKYQKGTFRAYGSFAPLDPPQPLERFSIRYANGSNFPRHMNLKREVPGSADVVVLPNLVFPPTGGWSNWVTDEFYFADIGNPGQTVPNLKLVSQTDEGGPNVQWIKVEYAYGSCQSSTGCYSTSFNSGGSVSCN